MLAGQRRVRGSDPERRSNCLGQKKTRENDLVQKRFHETGVVRQPTKPLQFRVGALTWSNKQTGTMSESPKLSHGGRSNVEKNDTPTTTVWTRMGLGSRLWGVRESWTSCFTTTTKTWCSNIAILKNISNCREFDGGKSEKSPKKLKIFRTPVGFSLYPPTNVIKLGCYVNRPRPARLRKRSFQ